jgi:hypothetical protein
MAISDATAPAVDTKPARGPFTQAAGPKTKMRPLGDRVVIRPTPREETTKSGIVLPDTAAEKPQ